jgi:hypothetical protein
MMPVSTIRITILPKAIPPEKAGAFWVEAGMGVVTGVATNAGGFMPAAVVLGKGLSVTNAVALGAGELVGLTTNVAVAANVGV